jgi:DNA polymerase-3 subunit delta'
MLWKFSLGQNRIKKHLTYLLENNQVPHAQLFTSVSGYGNLTIGLDFALQLLKPNGASKELKTLSECCQHPNLHFIYPVVKRGTEKIVFSSDYIREWYAFLDNTPYGNYIDWFESINVGNKQGAIGVSEIEKLHKSLYLKAFDGGKKVCVIWGIEKMNEASSNAFLKLLEEPPENTYFILLSESTEYVLPTVLSRCQEISLGPIEEEEIIGLIPDIQEDRVRILRQSEGNFRTLKLLQEENQNKDHEALLVNGLRSAFKAKGNKKVVIDLMDWSNYLASLGREKQKAFLKFGIQFFRDAFLKNYTLDELVHFKSETGFDLKKLAPYVHSGNIQELIKLFEDHHYYVQRNSNAKMMFAEMAFQLTRLINTPAA